MIQWLKACALTLLAVSLNIQAQQETARLAPLASESLLLDIQIIADQGLIAVGERGHILLSEDGEKWQQQNVPSVSTLTRAFFINEKLGWVVGHDAVILKTIDGGQNWQVQQFKPELQRPLFDVYFFDQQHGIAVGAYGFFYRTRNGGEDWVREFKSSLLNPDDADYLADLQNQDEEAYLEERNSILPHFNRLFVADEQVVLVGEMGLIAVSNNQGQDFELQPSIYHGSFFDVNRTANGNWLVAGLRGHVFMADAEMTEWQALETGTTALLNNIVSAQQGSFVLGNAGALLTLNNGNDAVNLSVLADGKALVAGVVFNNKLIMVSEVGIKSKVLN